MIKLCWMGVIALGFTVAGYLLALGEYAAFAYLSAGTWAWMVFPSVPLWLLARVAKIFARPKEVKA